MSDSVALKIFTTRRRALSAGACLLLVLAGFGCGGQERGAPSQPQAKMEPPVPEEGGTLVRRLTQDVNTLNLLLETLESEKMILSYVYDPLIDIDEKMKLIPGLAERWEVSPDGRTYTFFLNKNATWSDGKPVLASDVVFTLKKIVDPATQSSQFAGLFEGLNQQQTRALDASTAQVVFDQARASQLVAFNIGILPEHVYKKGSMTRDHNWKAIGSGPYVLSRREAGKDVLLTRRADYWRTKPYIERILFKVLPDDTVAWNAMKSGEIDETQVRSDFWKLERNEPQVRQTMEIHRFYSLGYNFIGWNNKDPILSDKNVRRAMTMSFDRRKIINNLYYGTARMISGPFTPDHWAYNPEVKPLEFDLRAARALLESAGWTDSNQDGFLDKDGRKMEIELLFRAGNTPSVQQGQVFQNDLRAIGVTLRLTPLDDASLIPKVLSGQYQGVFLGWNLDLDPDLYPLFHSTQRSPKGQNFVFYSNPEVDQLIEQGRIEMNDQKRVEIYHRLHAILAEDQPYTWTFQVSDKWGVNRRVKNVRAVDGLGLFWWYPDSLEWWIPRAHQREDASAAQSK